MFVNVVRRRLALLTNWLGVRAGLGAGLVQREFEIVFLVFDPRLFRLKVEQPLPVGDRNLVVVGMDFAEGEKPVPVAAIFDESGLQAGFDVSMSKSSRRVPSRTTTRVSSACVASINIRLDIGN